MCEHKNIAKRPIWDTESDNIFTEYYCQDCGRTLKIGEPWRGSQGGRAGNEATNEGEGTENTGGVGNRGFGGARN